MIYAEWILHFRTDALTEFFILFPYLTSGLFYMSVIAIGYWLTPQSSTFTQLGFLVPFSAIVTLFLKNSFEILRPPEELHMVPVETMLGFPSSDVMVAVVFWGICYLKWQQKYFRLASIILIASIMLSRVYLGVHSISDVIAGLFFGLAILFWWNSNYMQSIFLSWFKGNTLSYWGAFIILMVMHFVSSTDDSFTSMFIISSGALIGFGLSLNNIAKHNIVPGMFSGAHIGSVALSYIMLIILAVVIPTIYISEFSKLMSGALESALLIYMIFSVLPSLQRTIARKSYKKNFD